MRWMVMAAALLAGCSGGPSVSGVDAGDGGGPRDAARDARSDAVILDDGGVDGAPPTPDSGPGDAGADAPATDAGGRDAGPPDLDPVRPMVAAGEKLSCALDAAGEATCWTWIHRSNDHGQGEAPPGPFVHISAGYYTACGVRESGAIECWGSNESGQLDDVPGGVFVRTDVGAGVICGLRPSGTIECWGRNVDGEADVAPGTYTQVAAGNHVACGLLESGELRCWGRSVEVAETPTGEDFVGLSMLGAGGCALRATDDVVCWGQVADPPGSPAVQVEAGSSRGCLLRPSDRGLVCWGGWSGITGEWDLPDRDPFGSIAVGVDHGCGISPSGEGECWGAPGTPPFPESAL